MGGTRRCLRNIIIFSEPPLVPSTLVVKISPFRPWKGEIFLFLPPPKNGTHGRVPFFSFLEKHKVKINCEYTAHIVPDSIKWKSYPDEKLMRKLIVFFCAEATTCKSTSQIIRKWLYFRSPNFVGVTHIMKKDKSANPMNIWFFCLK